MSTDYSYDEQVCAFVFDHSAHRDLVLTCYRANSSPSSSSPSPPWSLYLSHTRPSNPVKARDPPDSTFATDTNIISSELENTAPKIQSAFKPDHADLVDAQRRRQKKKQRRLKRVAVAVVGWAFIAVNVYLMATTQRTAAKIWDPYDILGVSSVRLQLPALFKQARLAKQPHIGRDGKTDTVAISQAVCNASSRQSEAGSSQERDFRHNQRAMGGDHQSIQDLDR